MIVPHGAGSRVPGSSSLRFCSGMIVQHAENRELLGPSSLRLCGGMIVIEPRAQQSWCPVHCGFAVARLKTAMKEIFPPEKIDCALQLER